MDRRAGEARRRRRRTRPSRRSVVRARASAATDRAPPDVRRRRCRSALGSNASPPRRTAEDTPRSRVAWRARWRILLARIVSRGARHRRGDEDGPRSSWPCNRPTVPTRTAPKPRARSIARTRSTCARYGAITPTSDGARKSRRAPRRSSFDPEPDASATHLRVSPNARRGPPASAPPGLKYEGASPFPSRTCAPRTPQKSTRAGRPSPASPASPAPLAPDPSPASRRDPSPDPSSTSDAGNATDDSDAAATRLSS